jgi:hypothetical protein
MRNNFSDFELGHAGIALLKGFFRCSDSRIGGEFDRWRKSPRGENGIE